MPEHVHLLIYPTRAEYSISAILSTLKLPVTRRAERFVREQAPAFIERMTDRQPSGKSSLRFWQRGGGYDRNLWSEKYVWEMIDYIHNNPVRRGLCEAPPAWPWSSAAHYEERTRGPLRLDLESLPDDPRGRWRR
jgi:putative transposase